MGGGAMTRRRWTAEEEATLRDLYADTPTADIAQRLSRTERQVYCKAGVLGLRKSAAYLAGPHACRLRRGDDAGKQHRFRPGMTPWNAGKKGWTAGGRSAETRFKPGARLGRAAQLWQPIGSERMTKDGYRERKVTDTGVTRVDYVGLHRLLWEEHHGPVPAGHIVVFSNGDKTDIRIDNLECISRIENMRRNSVHRLPKELVEVVQLKGALQRQINRRLNR
jgi:hypothetical protein